MDRHLQEPESKQLPEGRQEDDSKYYVLTPKALEFIENLRPRPL